MRVGLIGPQRSHAGTGPYVSRFLKDIGCEVLEWTRAEASTFHTELAQGWFPESLRQIKLTRIPVSRLPLAAKQSVYSG